jgi:hypothetical protein
MTAPEATVLLDLAERCERATGPDWQLSRDIFKAIGGLPDVWCGNKVISWFGNGPWGCNTEDGLRHLHCTNAPAYTGSLDDALMLVPKGLDWRVDIMTGLPGAIVCQPNACLSTKTAPTMRRAATPALALCAAALRARSTDTGGK